MWGRAQEFLLNDRYLGALVKKWGNCTIKPTKKAQYFEDLVDSITSQQLSGKAAATIFGRVKDLCGGKITPEHLIKLDTENLRKCGLSYAKCLYVKDLASRAINGKLKTSNLDKLSDGEVINELVEVKGIGRWTAEMFLMFSLARPDVFPVDDLGIQKGFVKIIGKKWDKIKAAKFAEKHWKPYRSIACWYLWRSLENR